MALDVVQRFLLRQQCVWPALDDFDKSLLCLEVVLCVIWLHASIWQKKGLVGPELTRGGCSAPLSPLGEPVPLPSAPLLADQGLQSGGQLYPVSLGQFLDNHDGQHNG